MLKKHGFHRIINFCHMSFSSTHPSDEELLLGIRCNLSNARIYQGIFFVSSGNSWLFGFKSNDTPKTLRFPKYILKHPKSYLKILWAFPAWMKMTPVLTCMWGTCCQVPDREVFPGPGRHFLRDVGTCWNIENDEPWRKVKVVIFFHGFERQAENETTKPISYPIWENHFGFAKMKYA